MPSGTGARGVSTLGPAPRLATAEKQPALGQTGAAALMGAICMRGHGGPDSSTAPSPLAHTPWHPRLSFQRQIFPPIPINPSADVPKRALEVALLKSVHSERCHRAVVAPQSPALSMENGQKGLPDDVSHSQEDTAARLPSALLLSCRLFPYMGAQCRGRRGRCTPWGFSWQNQVFPFFSLSNTRHAPVHEGAGQRGGGLCFQGATASKQLFPNCCPPATGNEASLLQDWLYPGSFWHFHCLHESRG